MLKEAYVGELTGKVDFSLWFKRFSEGEKKNRLRKSTDLKHRKVCAGRKHRGKAKVSDERPSI